MFKKILIVLLILIADINANNTDNKRNITVFVHGTLFSSYGWLVHYIDCPLGFHKAQDLGERYVIGKIPFTLSKSSRDFPLDSFYLFGWSGYLGFEEREEAAHELYHQLKNLDQDCNITVIGQSHGCNVALNLAKIAKDHNDNDFKINKLILLAGPVQDITKDLVKYNVFKKVYALYSTADMMQILDPQGYYKETKDFRKKLNIQGPILSEKRFKPCSNLIQARILMNWQSPSHVDFILTKFLRQLPAVINLLDEVDCSEISNEQKSNFIINIPRFGQKPYFIKKNEIRKNIPRARR